MSEAAALPTKVDPQTLALRAKPRPVVRLNRHMLIALGGGLAAVVLGATVWSLQPSRRERNPAAELYNVDRVAKAETLDRLPKDYAGLPVPPPSVPKLGEPLPGDLGPAIVRAQRAGDLHGAGIDPAQAERLAAEEAARSPVFFRAASNGGKPVPGSQAASDAQPSPLAARPFDALSGVQSVVPANAAHVDDPTALQNRQDHKEAFAAPGGTATRNAGGLQLPASPYTVMASTVIPAALVTGINSDLPGQVVANVTEAVYDTATGRYLLIPQGSRLIGRYDSQVAFGQRRVLLVWTRLILPDASSIALDKLPGIDPAGYAGLEDGVDWHWDRILAGAALSTLLGVGAELAAPANSTDGNRVVIAARESAQDTVNQVGQELTKRNLSIQPTLTVRPGCPVRVMVNKDLVLRPYQPLFFPRGVSK